MTSTEAVRLFSFAVGSTLLVFTCALPMVGALFFGLGFPLSGMPLAAAACLATIYGWWISGRGRDPVQRVRLFALSMLAAVAICCACVYGGRAFYDVSFDGQAYHQEAIIRLKEGWNPYTEATRFPDDSTLLWVNHYPKAAWINAAVLYRVTNRLESGKAFNLLLVIASFCLALAALDRVAAFAGYKAVVVALLASLNPVSLCQALSFYVDGQIASLIVSLAALAYLWLMWLDRAALVLLVPTIVMIINVKFTGLVYGVVLGAGVALVAAKVMPRALAVRTSWAIAAAALAGVLLVGYNPYVTNVIGHGHPLYPLDGEIGTRVFRADRPAKFQPLDRFRKLFNSVFSESRQPPEPSHLKLPLSVTRAEISAFHLADVRVGGFGPLFGGAVIAGAAVLAGAWPRHRRKAYAAAGIVFWILLSACINPEAWWARLAPQIWLIPVVALILGFTLVESRPLSFCSYGLAAILLADIVLVATPYVRHQTRMTRDLQRQLAELAARPAPALINFEYFLSNRVRLREAGVDYREIDGTQCVDAVTLVSSTTRICRVKP